MIQLLPAITLTRSLSELGALLALAGLVAIALLALLFFVQGRELRRLKEWSSQLSANRPPNSRRAVPEPRVAVRSRQPQPVGATAPAQPAAAVPAIPRPTAPAPALTAAAQQQPSRPTPPQTPLPHPSEFRFLREEPRSRLPFAVAALAALAVAVGAFLATGVASNRAVPAAAPRSTATRSARPSQSAVPLPAELQVTVLNATEINGLAHKVAARLQSAGYSRAQALNGRPSGSFTTTVVEYGHGLRQAAERLARALALEGGAVKPLEGGVASLAGGAQVVVVATASTQEPESSEAQASGSTPPPTEAEGQGTGEGSAGG